MSVVNELPRELAERRSHKGEPTWELALTFPRQGEWSEGDYLTLEQQGKRIELVDGCLEFLPMPTPRHQLILQFVYECLMAHLRATRIGGNLLLSPCPLRLWPGRIREPDLFYLPPGQLRDVAQPPEGAQLVVEIVSEGNRNQHRDLVEKRLDYARAGVQEYWIIDPANQRFQVLTRSGDDYTPHGDFTPDTTATSLLFPGLTIPVVELFAAGNGTTPTT